MILTSARKAHNELNYPFAIQRYAEFLQKFGGHAQANAARYQLALAYIESPERNYDKALETLNPIVGNAGHERSFPRKIDVQHVDRSGSNTDFAMQASSSASRPTHAITPCGNDHLPRVQRPTQARTSSASAQLSTVLAKVERVEVVSQLGSTRWRVRRAILPARKSTISART